MEDVQSSADQRGIAIQKVGINDVHLPLLIKMKDGGLQQVLARNYQIGRASCRERV